MRASSVIAVSLKTIFAGAVVWTVATHGGHQKPDAAVKEHMQSAAAIPGVDVPYSPDHSPAMRQQLTMLVQKLGK